MPTLDYHQIAAALQARLTTQEQENAAYRVLIAELRAVFLKRGDRATVGWIDARVGEIKGVMNNERNQPTVAPGNCNQFS